MFSAFERLVLLHVNPYIKAAKPFKSSPGGLDVKESMCNAGDLGSIPVLGRFPGGGRHGNPHQYSCLENIHGQRSLVGYCPWGLKDSDTTEWLRTKQHNDLQLIDREIFVISLEV